jgi:tripartite-type tricarboxylate transporter receptor subunit TctC
MNRLAIFRQGRSPLSDRALSLRLPLRACLARQVERVFSQRRPSQKFCNCVAFRLPRHVRWRWDRIMKATRRDFLYFAAALAAIEVNPRLARGENYPSRPVRIISGFPPGGINDTYARLIGQWLAEHFGQQFIVENRSGAGGTLAAEAVARSAPDGYTLHLTTSADAWNASLYDKLNFNVIRDFTPVATIARGPGVLVVHPSLPVKSVPELIAYAKSNPGKVTVASAGIGSAPHMYWELFRSVTGIDMVHVPYRGGGPAVTDLLGGQVLVYFGTFASTIQSVRADKLRALAVTSAKRVAVLPDVPAMAEYLPGYEASIYVGIAAPRDTPSAIVEQLNRTINLAFDDAMITRRIADLGDSPLSLSSSEFAKLVADEAEKWRKVIAAGNIRAE